MVEHSFVEHGDEVDDGIYRKPNPLDYINECALENNDIGILIINFVEKMMNMSAIF